VLQVVVSILLMVVVMLQSSDEDVLSGIGAGASQSKLLSHKSSADLITKITIVLGVIFMLNSFFLASIYTHQYTKDNRSIVQNYLKEEEESQKDRELMKNINLTK
jgi:preprotein translocase subunit SecG